MSKLIHQAKLFGKSDFFFKTSEMFCLDMSAIHEMTILSKVLDQIDNFVQHRGPK